MWKAAIILIGLLACTRCPATTVLFYHTSNVMIFAGDSLQIKLAHGRDLADASLICKIHVTGNFTWAAAGILNWTPTNIEDRSIDLRRIVNEALVHPATFKDAADLLYEQVAREYPALRQHAIDIGYDPGDAGIQLVVVRFEGAVPHYSVMLFKQPEPERLDCPGKSCADGMFELGTHDRVDALVHNLAELQALMKRRGIAGALRYLISEQEEATPVLVGGRISILRLDVSGRHWIDRGVCN